MDKKEAIEFLKQSLSEIPHLAKLPHNNHDYPLWHKVIEGILEEVFGRDSSEYQNFLDATLKFRSLLGDAQKDYLAELKMRETALLSIIQKWEILGIEAKPTAMAELPNAPQDYEDKEAIKKLELILEGTPDMILECIRSIVEKLNSQGYTYGFRRTSGAPDYARWDKTYFASCAIFQSEGQVGIIKLELLPKEKTLLKFLEPKDWDSAFGHFLNQLFIEFQRLGFVDFKKEKPPIGFKLPHKEKGG